MDYNQAIELAKWMAIVAEKYNKPILVVVDVFTKASKAHQDINLAKITVVNDFSQAMARNE